MARLEVSDAFEMRGRVVVGMLVVMGLMVVGVWVGVKLVVKGVWLVVVR